MTVFRPPSLSQISQNLTIRTNNAYTVIATRMLTVDAPHFNAGLELRCTEHGGPVVVAAAPIVRYMFGWGEGRVRSYCAGRGWTVMPDS